MFFKFYLSDIFLVWTLLALHSLQATSECTCKAHRAIVCAEQNLREFPRLTDCDRVISLDLTNNKITTLSSQDFTNLSGLNDHLYLDENDIKKISNQTFIYLTHLAGKLHLQSNQLRRLEPGSFDGLDKLSVLNLDHNKLTEIVRGVFGDLPCVTHLSLANNAIRNISNGSFVGMKKLKEINLGNNNITILLNYTFKGLKTVKKIDLSHNNIQRMEWMAFQDLANLTNLNLSFNEIVSVSAIRDLRFLNVLDLHRNSISKLNSLLNPHLTSINYKFNINVSSNPLDCDCESIQPLLDWYIKQQEISNNVAQCRTPVNQTLSRDLKKKCETVSPQSQTTNARTLTSGSTTSSRNDATIKTTHQSMTGTHSIVTGVIVGLLIICSVVFSYKSFQKYRVFTRSRPMMSAQLPNPTSLTTRPPPPLPRLPVTPGRPIVPQRSVSRHSMLALWSQGRIYFTRVTRSPRHSFQRHPDRDDMSMTGHLSAASTSTGFQNTSSVSRRIPNHNSRHHESNIRTKPSAFFDQSQSITTFTPRPRSQVQSYITRIFTGNQRKRLQLQPVCQDNFAPTPNSDIIHTHDRWDVNTAADDLDFSTAPYSPDHDTTRHWVQPSRVPLASPMATEYQCNSSWADSLANHERRDLPQRPTAMSSECGPFGNSVKGYRTQINHKLHHKPLPPLDPDIIITTDHALPVPSLAGHLLLTKSYSNVSSNCSGLSITVGKRDWPTVTQRPSRINNVKEIKRAWLQEDNYDFRSVNGCNVTSTDQTLMPPAPSMAGHSMVSTSSSLNTYENQTPHLEKLSSGFSRIDDTTVSTPSVAPHRNMMNSDPLSPSTSSNYWSLRNTKSCSSHITAWST